DESAGRQRNPLAAVASSVVVRGPSVGVGRSSVGGSGRSIVARRPALGVRGPSLAPRGAALVARPPVCDPAVTVAIADGALARGAGPLATLRGTIGAQLRAPGQQSRASVLETDQA